MSGDKLSATAIAEAAYEALRSFIVNLCTARNSRRTACPRELEKSSADVCEAARDLMLFLASIARMARSARARPRDTDD